MYAPPRPPPDPPRAKQPPSGQTEEEETRTGMALAIRLGTYPPKPGPWPWPGSFINGRAPGWPGRGNVRLSRENAGCETAFPISGGSPKWCSVMGWFQS
jgi:hypothetical protein